MIADVVLTDTKSLKEGESNEISELIGSLFGLMPQEGQPWNEKQARDKFMNTWKNFDPSKLGVAP